MKRKIFIEGKDYYERAYIGWQEECTSLQGIKMGYKNSADNLVEVALKMGEEGRIDILDTYIFPIVFLYRHSIEVSLKHIYYRATNRMPKGGHDLLFLWDTLNEEILNEDIFVKLISLNNNEKNNIRELLIELQGKYKDEKSDVWRYTIDKRGELYFSEWEYIDYSNLKESLSWLYDELDGLYCEIDYVLSK